MTVGDDLRALREPRPRLVDEEARIDRYAAILRDGQLPMHVLHGLVLNMVGRIAERDPTLLDHAEVREAFAMIGTPSFTEDVPPERQAAHDALRALAGQQEVEARHSALRAFADAVIMWPQEAAYEIAHYAMQHVSMSAHDDALSIISIGREVTQQIDALLGLLS